MLYYLKAKHENNYNLNFTMLNESHGDLTGGGTTLKEDKEPRPKGNQANQNKEKKNKPKKP